VVRRKKINAGSCLQKGKKFVERNGKPGATGEDQEPGTAQGSTGQNRKGNLHNGHKKVGDRREGQETGAKSEGN